MVLVQMMNAVAPLLKLHTTKSPVLRISVSLFANLFPREGSRMRFGCREPRLQADARLGKHSGTDIAVC